MLGAGNASTYLYAADDKRIRTADFVPGAGEARCPGKWWASSGTSWGQPRSDPLE